MFRDLVAQQGERLLLVLALWLLLGAAEWANPFPSSRPHDRAETRRHLAWLGVFFVVGPTVGWVVNHAIRVAARWSPLDGPVGAAPFAARIAVAVVAGEFVAYWLHRAMHVSKWLWALHAIHHRATEVRWWTAFRAHPLSGLLVHVLPFAAAAATGAGRDAVAVYVTAVVVLTVVAHADVYLPARGLDLLLVTPAFHRRHHERGGDREHYAQILPAMDRLFGTAPHASKAKPIDRDVRLAAAEATAPRNESRTTRPTTTAS